MTLKNKVVVITAGPTRELIDPVRYISNYSSGKMGYSLAISAIEAGAKVILISGPCSLSVPVGLLDFVSVTSADEMLCESKKHASNSHIFIACAAVADYKPRYIAPLKIKKLLDKEVFTLEMIKTPDIVSIVKQWYPKLFVVGFAAETNNILEYAKSKLVSKKLDMIIVNNVADGKVFGQDQNQVSVLNRFGDIIDFELQDKSLLATKLVEYISLKI